MDVKRNPWLVLSILFISFSLRLHVSVGADTDRITANQSLSGDQTIVSAGGVFKLGFFKPGNSSNYYVGMWYKTVSTQTIVWVANRDAPVSDRFSCELRMSDGNLILFNESKASVWSTNLNSTGTIAVEAVLGDDGNLVLRDGSSSSPLLWQSFEHPAHTWLPGARIGLNKLTKRSTRLISWKSNDDPAPGLFSLELDPSGTNSYILLWNGTKQYWTSGPWNGQIFSSVPEMRANYIYNFSYVNNDTVNYFTYNLYNTTIISRFIMHVGGQIQQQSWTAGAWILFWSQPRAYCEVYGYCGTFGSCSMNSQPNCDCLMGFSPRSEGDWNSGVYSGGCGRRESLQCGNSSLANTKEDRFSQNDNMQLPENAQVVAAGSQQECESSCLSNCSCTAYAFNNNQCSVWYEDLWNLQQLANGDPNARTLYVRLAASEFSGSKSNKGAVIGGVVGSVVTVLLCLILYVFLRRKRSTSMGKTVEGSLVAFGYRDLQNTTKNFSEKLGGGGFGSVFKGMLPDSSIIAVKMLESISQGEKQFRTEVSTIGTIQHVNLVRLRGFCSEGTKKLLVYDYMPNGSLDSHLFVEKDSKNLDWEMRYRIALGVGRGLTYLHEKCRDCIIHCDIKPENILLDAEFCPKVADFGLAKLVGRDFSRVLTTMRGTRGYLAPEWISGLAITAKADVYSYGMMLFELISGRRNSEQVEDGKVKFFPSLVASQTMEGGDVLGLLDPRLEGNADPDELLRVCKVACWCIQEEETQRPSMGQVVQILEGVLNVNLPPTPRSLQLFDENHEDIIFFTESSSSRNSQTQSNVSTASSQVKSTTSWTSSKS